MKQEFDRRKHELKEPVETIYFGGGSPGLLTPKELEMLLKEPLSLAGNQLRELTLEANPEDVTEPNLTAWKNLGNHSVEQSLGALTLLETHNFSLSIDLIFGIPNQLLSDVLAVIELVDQYHIEHLSAYALTKEPNTALDRWIKQGKNPDIDDELQIEHYYAIQDALKERNFTQYEVSNYAKNNKVDKHNTNYWAGKPYLGIGPGAHSFDGKTTRRWNVSNNQRYLNQQKWYEIEALSEKNIWNECWLTGLRTANGVSLDKLQLLGGLSNKEEETLKKLREGGMLRLENTHYTLTDSAWLSADRLASELFRI